jgi:hypothetical protein
VNLPQNTENLKRISGINLVAIAIHLITRESTKLVFQARLNQLLGNIGADLLNLATM